MHNIILVRSFFVNWRVDGSHQVQPIQMIRRITTHHQPYDQNGNAFANRRKVKASTYAPSKLCWLRIALLSSSFNGTQQQQQQQLIDTYLLQIATKSTGPCCISSSRIESENILGFIQSNILMNWSHEQFSRDRWPNHWIPDWESIEVDAFWSSHRIV